MRVLSPRWCDRLLDALPILTTLFLLSLYPLLRSLSGEPVWAGLFHLACISAWIGYLLISLALAHTTRRELIRTMETDWYGRLHEAGRPFRHVVILMPLKRETNRHVLFQTFLSVARQHYPRDKVTVVPIIEVEDTETLSRVQEILPALRGRVTVEVLTYPAGEVAPRCKATSLSTAGRWLSARVEAGEFSAEALTVVIIDADTILHPQDLAFREYTHRREEAEAPRHRARGVILQSLTTYTTNYWKVPMLPRLHNTGFVLYQMGKMQSRGDYLVLGPGTSVPFALFREVDYFEPNRHNEDMQFRYKVVMEGYRVAPLFLPTWGQAPLTTRESWQQIARWARGAVDVKFIVNYRRRFRTAPLPLTKTKTFLALRALVANAMPPLMVLLPLQLILFSWLTPCGDPGAPGRVFPSPDVFLLTGHTVRCAGALSVFTLRFQAIILTSSMLLGMVLVPHLLRPILYGQPPRRWTGFRRFFEWFRVVFTPINLHTYFLMASAQLYTQTRLALGLSIARTDVTRK